MAKLVLVPGAWHGPCGFARLVPLLEAAGHEVAAVDLPVEARGMADWVAVVLAAAGAGPAVLVGHSRGGMVISAVAEAAPERVAQLVYVSGFVPGNGQSLFGITKAHGGTLIPLEVDQASKTCLPAEVDLVELFYHDCDPDAVALALEGLRPEPLFGLTAPVTVTPARFGSVAKAYVECSEDRAISLVRQRQMQASWPMRQLRTLPTGHSPFLSNPAALATALIGLLEDCA